MPKPAKFELYQDRAKRWRWRLRGPNGELVAYGGEPFSSRRAAVQATRKLHAWALAATLAADVAKRGTAVALRRSRSSRAFLGAS